MDYEQLNNANPDQDLPFDAGASDEELITAIDTWVNESRTYHDTMLIQQNRAVRYYLGDQTDLRDIPPYKASSVYNRIFEATETIVPVVTGSAHQFLAVPGEENELSVERAKKLQKVLIRTYEDIEMQRHLENVTRDIILKRFGVIEWFWDPSIDNVNVRTIDPRLILIPRLRVDANELPYALELQEYIREEIEQFFPDVNPDDLVIGRTNAEFTYQDTYQPPVLTTTALDEHVYQIICAKTPEYWVWKQNDKVLKRMPNPYFDFEGEEVETTEEGPNGKIKETKYRRFLNHLERPRLNLVFFNPFTTGEAPVSDTSLAETGIPIQDDINTQKRQIINNLLQMGNGQIYVDSEAMPQELVDQITSEPGLIIQGKNLASENRIRREAGVPLPEAHFANLQDSIVAFDNVFGTQAAIRGQQQGGTLGGQIINREQALSRIEQITRVLNRGVNRVADGLVQMMRMYYTEDQLIKIIGKDGAIEFLKFSQRDIDDGTLINVKSGVPVTLDPQARFNQAIQLWQLGAIDPETLFERLDFPDPQLAAQKLAAWRSGQLLLESQLRREESMVGMPSGGGTGTPMKDAGMETARDVETPGDQMVRAAESMNAGGEAPLTRTSNGAQPNAIA